MRELEWGKLDTSIKFLIIVPTIEYQDARNFNELLMGRHSKTPLYICEEAFDEFEKYFLNTCENTWYAFRMANEPINNVNRFYSKCVELQDFKYAILNEEQLEELGLI